MRLGCMAGKLRCCRQSAGSAGSSAGCIGRQVERGTGGTAMDCMMVQRATCCFEATGAGSRIVVWLVRMSGGEGLTALLEYTGCTEIHGQLVNRCYMRWHSFLRQSGGRGTQIHPWHYRWVRIVRRAAVDAVSSPLVSDNLCIGLGARDAVHLNDLDSGLGPGHGAGRGSGHWDTTWPRCLRLKCWSIQIGHINHQTVDEVLRVNRQKLVEAVGGSWRSLRRLDHLLRLRRWTRIDFMPCADLSGVRLEPPRESGRFHQSPMGDIRMRRVQSVARLDVAECQRSLVGADQSEWGLGRPRMEELWSVRGGLSSFREGLN